MKQETLKEAAITYAHKSFVWPLNKQGEKQSIPPGQLVPTGYTKHQKIATKHFTAGYKLAQERMYNEEEAGELVYNIIGEYAKHYSIMIDGAKLNELFEQFKKK